MRTRPTAARSEKLEGITTNSREVEWNLAAVEKKGTAAREVDLETEDREVGLEMEDKEVDLEMEANQAKEVETVA